MFPLSTSTLIFTPHSDPAAIRCYALHTGMTAVERAKLGKQVLSNLQDVDFPMYYEERVDGTEVIVDVLVVPTLEIERVHETRNALAAGRDFYSLEDGILHNIPLVANVHGTLILKTCTALSLTSELVHTLSAADALRKLAIHVIRSHISPPSSVSYVSSPTQLGTFEWKDGIVVHAMKEGKWLGIDKGSMEVLGLVKPVAESIGPDNWIGARACIEVPNRGKAYPTGRFALFVARSVVPSSGGKIPDPAFNGAYKFREVIIEMQSLKEINTIFCVRSLRLGAPATKAIVRMWTEVQRLGSMTSILPVVLKHSEKCCGRVESRLPASRGMDIDHEDLVTMTVIFPNPTVREERCLESQDVFFGAGGFKPTDAGSTFSRKKNLKFKESVRKAVQEGKCTKAVALWKESARLSKERISARLDEGMEEPTSTTAEDGPRKRRKVDGQVCFRSGGGPFVKALRSGDRVLLDEINLASSETLACIPTLFSGPMVSITLTEKGSLEAIPCHPDFRLFVCMNRATDVGKKDLPPNIRAWFAEFDVPPPDADREILLHIIAQYIGDCAVGDKAAVMDVAEFYTAGKKLTEERQPADGSDHQPHYSMRTLARASTFGFAANIAPMYSLRRALWEGCLMAFTMVLDGRSADTVAVLSQRHNLAGY
ncbi:hypothetical protein ID866_9047 [Astraeus odoratus]|nr:hypothetical protein ID866_9047 [Astraeus odoratus]